VTDDEGFGPVLQGSAGGGQRRAGAPDVADEASPPRPRPRYGDDYGPVLRGRHRRRVGRRLAKTLFVLLLVAAVAGAGLATALLVYTSAHLQREPVRGLQPALGGPMNVLVVGSDSREGLTEEDLLRLGTHAVEGMRTDTILLLSISGGRAAMLSFPRDLFVTRCDGTRARINTAYAAGGPSCMVETVRAMTGIAVTHYAEMNFLGFIRVVDAVGGVTVDVPAPLVDQAAGVNLDAGCQRLDGYQAIGYVRARKVDNDLGRVQRQQQFIRAVAAEVTAPSTLLNVPRLFAVARDGGQAITVNERLGIIDLLRLARGARGLAGAGVATYTVPATPGNVGGAAVLFPAEAAADALFARFRDGSVLRTLTPADVPVTVLNGAGVEGLAAQGADHLQAAGFVVTDVGNHPGVDHTVVRHAPGDEAAARLVADHLPAAALQPAEPGTPLTVILGPEASFAAPAAPPPQAPDGAPPPEGPRTPAC
jgi:LCP family protein required for cell wall assembly